MNAFSLVLTKGYQAPPSHILKSNKLMSYIQCVCTCIHLPTKIHTYTPTHTHKGQHLYPVHFHHKIDNIGNNDDNHKENNHVHHHHHYQHSHSDTTHCLYFSVVSFFCHPSIADCRLLIAQQPLEFRDVIGRVFCVNTRRGNSGRVCMI